MTARAWLFLGALSLCATAAAQPPAPASGADGGQGETGQRPPEDAMFGGSPEEPQPGPEAQPEQERPGEEAMFAASAPAATTSQEAAPEDPLKVGGQLYLRSEVRAQQGVAFEETPVSAPILVDAYFDARPNDRVRGVVVGRLRYNPLVDPNERPSLGATPERGPTALLDQLWLRFDVYRTVFVTAGQQHIKWGAARFWNPTDFLNPVRRDPLAVFDVRTGVTMLKLHVPWEEKGWNAYGFVLLDNFDPSSTLGRVGGAARVEVVVGTAEFSASVVAQRDRKPRFGADVSAGLGPFDVYAELGVRDGSESAMWRLVDEPDPAAGLDGLFEGYLPAGLKPAVAAGANGSIVFGDNDQLTIGVEYFYNSLGYSNASMYPWLIYQGRFQPFYVGQHYGAIYAMLPNPGSWDNTTFVLSTLGNFSDLSFVTRLDVHVTVLTHLRLEAYAAAHYGHKGGEFRFAVDLPPSTLGGKPLPALVVPPPLFEMGFALRIAI